MNRVDIAVIGTGPAGLEAAITARARNKSVLLLGSSALSVKVEKAHAIQNYLGLPDISGDAMQAAFHAHLTHMEITVTEDTVLAVYPMGDYFALQGHADIYEARKVILACGMPIVRTLPGEEEHLGRGVSYCATCDAMLYRGRDVIVLGYTPAAEHEADFLSEIAAQVTYLPLYKDTVSVREQVKLLPNMAPAAIERDGERMLLTASGEPLTADCIFILRESVPPAQLVRGLAIENNHVLVDRAMRTNLPGIYACGDITGAPYQYIKAAGEGNVAALSAVADLITPAPAPAGTPG